jgi:hypothetical protein
MQCWRVQHVPTTERVSLASDTIARFAADPAHEMLGSAKADTGLLFNKPPISFHE